MKELRPWYLYYGESCAEKGAFIDQSRHKVLQSPHPSPLSSHRGFFGSRPFSKANQFLESQGMEGIDWFIPDL